VDSEPEVTGRETDFLDGVDSTLAGLRRFAPASEALGAKLQSLQALLSGSRAAFDARSPEAAARALVSALQGLRALRQELAALVGDPRARAEIDARVGDEEHDVADALRLAHGLVVEARADDGLVTPGQAFGVSVVVSNGASRAIDVEGLELEAPAGWTVERREANRPPAGPAALAGGASRTARFQVTVAPDARPSQPYWRKLPDRDRHALLVPEHETLPWSPPPVTARVRLLTGGVPLLLEVPAIYRYEGRFVGGERRHALTVVPELSLRLDPEVGAIPLAGPKRPIEVRVSVRSHAKGAGEAAVRLEAPQGFAVEPAGITLPFAVEGEDAVARFQVTPPAAIRPGTHALRAIASRGGRDAAEYVQPVEYDHVERRQLLRPAETRLLALDVRTAPGVRVGYVMGSGDAIADAIEQLGVPLTRLTADDLVFSDLGRFSTIVTGIRAYETRPDLRSAHGRLMRWVQAGGHLVVQYNRAAMNRLAPEAPALAAGSPSPYVPYPAVVTSDRISDETAAMRVLVPDHPLLTSPNRIAEADWSGWVQERGIQLLAASDARYQELLAATDPFAYNAGEKRGLLTDARVGQGTWTYVGLVLFREVPAGVPGGWRLLANLVSRPPARPPN
jgi:hypothetical protein